MNDYHRFCRFSPTVYGDILPVDRVMDHGIRPLWPQIDRIAGPACTVRCAPGDNLMLHAAIHRARPGTVIVVQAGDEVFAVAGGNVCATAQKRGIAGFVIDGVIRDLGEIREKRFPVFARGISPKPGAKRGPGSIDDTVCCGRVLVSAGDMVIADEEGIVVIRRGSEEEVLQAASQKAEKDAAEDLEHWSRRHRAMIEQLMTEKGYLF